MGCGKKWIQPCLPIMPELPEVETIRRGLRKVLPGTRIIQADIRLAKMVHMSSRAFRLQVQGATIQAVDRKAKLVVITLNRGLTMVIHLKMTGQLVWRPKRGNLTIGGHAIPGGTQELPNKFSHVFFTTDKGTLFFNDQRQFGFIKLFRGEQFSAWLKNQHYGPDPMDRKFTFGVFEELLKRHAKKKIKPTLMDQTVIAGVGNIYADEACFAARIRPSRRITTLSGKEKRDLYRGLIAVLRLAIRLKGTTADAYRTAHGQPGKMLPFLKVYRREGLSCRRCRATILKTTLAGRGTHYCPNCQR